MLRALKERKSISVAIGGVREISENSSTEIRTTVGSRAGIYRLALETGATLVPVISYGENDLFKLSNHWLVTYINKLIQPFGVVLPIPSYDSVSTWLNIRHSTHPHGAHTVMGEPVKPIDSIEKTREAFIQSIDTLYSATRPTNYEEKIVFI